MLKYLSFIFLLACATVHYSTVKKVVKTNGIYIVTTDKGKSIMTKNEYQVGDKIATK